MKDTLYTEQTQRDKDEDVWIYKERHGLHICTKYSRHGVTIQLEHNTNDNEYETFFVRMIVNPRKLLDPESSYLGILEPRKNSAQKVRKAFRKLFENTCFDEEIDTYHLRRVDLCTNVHCDNAKIFGELIRAAQKLPTPPKYSRKWHCGKDKQKTKLYNKHYIRYVCGTHELVLYDKTYQMKENKLLLSYEKLPEGVLRYEMRLERDYIRRIQKNSGIENTTELLEFFIENSAEFLVATFNYCFPVGIFLRLGELENYIQAHVNREETRRRMLALVEKLQHGPNTDEALTELEKEGLSTDGLLKHFYNLGISPVPLRKNFSAVSIPNPTKLLLDLMKGEPVKIRYIRSK